MLKSNMLLSLDSCAKSGSGHNMATTTEAQSPIFVRRKPSNFAIERGTSAVQSGPHDDKAFSARLRQTTATNSPWDTIWSYRTPVGTGPQFGLTTNYDALIESVLDVDLVATVLLAGLGSSRMNRTASEGLFVLGDPEGIYSDKAVAGKYVLDQLASAYPEAAARLSALQKLQPDWDGFGGYPPSEEALVTTASLIILCQSLSEEKLPSPFIAPLPNGGLEIEWNMANGTELMLVIPRSGHDVYFLLDVLRPGGEVAQSEGTVPFDANVSTLIRKATVKE